MSEKEKDSDRSFNILLFRSISIDIRTNIKSLKSKVSNRRSCPDGTKEKKT